MESALRPRDIQARIRAGESLDAVAQAAGVPIERIEPFAGPVIAEREHIAGLAQTNPVRRAGDAVAHRSLRTVVAERLLAHGVDADDVEWDAWRTENRRWTVRLSYESGSAESGATQHQADFSYDQTGRFSTALNDDARWLTGEQSGSQRSPGGSSQELNDELAIVRAIQPQFAVTPDVEDDDLVDEPLDDDGSSDSEDAFAEGDLAEVDGVYDIVPGDGSNMDVLYDMLSTFDEDSVQIYAGLVRPRPEQAAGPVLDEGPVRSEIITGEIEFDGSEPTERLFEADDEDVEDTDLIEAELAADGPSPTALANAATDDDLVVDEPHERKADESTADQFPVDEPPIDESPIGEATVEEAGDEEAGDAGSQAGEPVAGPLAGAPAADRPTRKPRPGQVKPSPAEPEQPSLVDEAGNEPSRSIKRKRASVPSWDEIMFGSPKPKG